MGRPHADPVMVELAIARQAKGLTQAAVAKMIGVSANAVSKWESGTRIIPLDHARDYATAVGRDLGVIRPGDDTTRPHDMGHGELAETLRVLTNEAAARLEELDDDPRHLIAEATIVDGDELCATGRPIEDIDTRGLL